MFHFPIPFLNRPILWYGFFFALGFFLAYWVLLFLLKKYFHASNKNLSPAVVHQRATKMAEKLTLYVMIGAIVGARLGDVLFYQDLKAIAKDPLSIIAVWQGGLASHGGAVGILIALWLFSRSVKVPFLRCLDFTVVPTALAAVCIRVGNFFNQEILGTKTELPWGVVFGHPADGGPVVPRHPAQLYEACAYLVIFFLLFFYATARPHFERKGKLTGLFLVLVFGFRFAIEFLKVEQSATLSTASWLTMGQWLSIPFILMGLFLVLRNRERGAKN